MKTINFEGQIFGLSTLRSGRHHVCMSCYDSSKETLTPLVRIDETRYQTEDPDYLIDDDVTLCKDCSFKEFKMREGLEVWISLSVDKLKELWRLV
jgi:hypothetical protein